MFSITDFTLMTILGLLLIVIFVLGKIMRALIQ
jgi:hypothetical protein